MLIDKREIERVKRANELVGFIRSRGVTVTQRGKPLDLSFVDQHPLFSVSGFFQESCQVKNAIENYGAR